VVMASRIETMKREIKACSLNRVVRIITRIMQIRTNREMIAAFMALNTD